MPLGDRTISTSLTESEGARLAELASGRRVLELGSANGYSAVRMAASAAGVLAVDPHAHVPGSLERMRENLSLFDPERRVSMLLAFSEDALPWLASVGARFDLIFIDADHSEKAVLHDVAHAYALLAPGAVMVCHDYGEDSCPGVKLALDASMGAPDALTDTLWEWTQR